MERRGKSDDDKENVGKNIPDGGAVSCGSVGRDRQGILSGADGRKRNVQPEISMTLYCFSKGLGEGRAGKGCIDRSPCQVSGCGDNCPIQGRSRDRKPE